MNVEKYIVHVQCMYSYLKLNVGPTPNLYCIVQLLIIDCLLSNIESIQFVYKLTFRILISINGKYILIRKLTVFNIKTEC